MEAKLITRLGISFAELRNASASPAQGVASVALALLFAGLGFLSVRFLLIDAVWSGGADACRTGSGACWPFVVERGSSMVFGFVPRALQVALIAVVLGLALAPLALRMLPETIPRTGRHAIWTAVVVIPLCAALLAGGPPRLSDLGGVLLTLTVSAFALITGLPLGIGLALMRTSKLPVARVVATLWIEIWRGIPTVVALFFAIAVFPLLVPKDVDISKLLRALLAFTALTSALFAEAIRGGLQSIASEQREAAQSLGLGTFATIRLVVLPQALMISMPNIVNISVALIKETTLILLVGLYDLFGIVQTAIVDPKWTGGSVTATGYIIAAGFYLLVCVALSKLARGLEANSRSRS